MKKPKLQRPLKLLRSLRVGERLYLTLYAAFFSIPLFLLLIVALFFFVELAQTIEPSKQGRQYQILISAIALVATLAGLSFRAGSSSKNQDHALLFYEIGVQLFYAVILYVLSLLATYCYHLMISSISGSLRTIPVIVMLSIAAGLFFVGSQRTHLAISVLQEHLFQRSGEGQAFFRIAKIQDQSRFPFMDEHYDSATQHWIRKQLRFFAFGAAAWGFWVLGRLTHLDASREVLPTSTQPTSQPILPGDSVVVRTILWAIPLGFLCTGIFASFKVATNRNKRSGDE